jgi:hypothetical protein
MSNIPRDTHVPFGSRGIVRISDINLSCIPCLQFANIVSCNPKMRATLDLILCPLTVDIRNKNPREIRVGSAKFGSDPFSGWHVSCMLADLMNLRHTQQRWRQARLALR